MRRKIEKKGRWVKEDRYSNDIYKIISTPNHGNLKSIIYLYVPMNIDILFSIYTNIEYESSIIYILCRIIEFL